MHIIQMNNINEFGLTKENIILKDTILLLRGELFKERAQKEVHYLVMKQFKLRLDKAEDERDKLLEACIALESDCPARQLAYSIKPVLEPQESPPKRPLLLGRQSLVFDQVNDPESVL